MKKYSELLTLPVAILLVLLYNSIADYFGLHSFTIDQLGKAFPSLFLFLTGLFVVRIVMIFTFPVLYRYFDPSFKYNFKWKLLDAKEKFKYGFVLFCVLAITWALIVSGQ